MGALAKSQFPDLSRSHYRNLRYSISPYAVWNPSNTPRVPSHIIIESNDRADKLANEATNLDVIEYAEHTPGTFNHLVDRFIPN